MYQYGKLTQNELPMRDSEMAQWVKQLPWESEDLGIAVDRGTSCLSGQKCFKSNLN